jgi:cardiolipin synthase
MESAALHLGNHFLAIFIPLTDFFIRIGLCIRVIMRQRQYGVTLAWLIIILLLPFLGAFVYLLFGENRIGDTRARRAQEALAHYHKWIASLHNIAPVNWSDLSPELEPIHKQADSLVGIPTMGGNILKLIENPEKIIRTIISDIDNAKSTCQLQFYIWHEGGTADDVVTAVIRAVKRGVTCRVLVDSIGSKQFLRGRQVQTMRAAGVRVLESLPAGFFKTLFVRIDIRNHRKLVVIDGKIAYSGSQNMVDPRFFKQNSGVGQWVDSMVRIQGPVVEALAGTFISDWFMETDHERINSRSLNKDIQQVRTIADINHQPSVGDIPIQLVPSGPSFEQESIHQLLLTTIYASRKNITLTTPYFVPDESILTALQSAAHRGVDVRIIIPEKNDSKLVHFASYARFEKMLKSGITIKLFTGGLLHSKTITVDDEFALFGSVNIDMRSFWLNFETTLFIYNQKFTRELRKMQAAYELSSTTLSLDDITNRSFKIQLLENAALIISPLL